MNFQPATFEFETGGPPPPERKFAAFSLIEVMLVMSLLALIVFALMSVFSATQTAFRASVTQTDVLEGGRAAMELISSDLRQMTPSGSYSNGAVNFAVVNRTYNPPLVQTLVGSFALRTNLLDYFFILSRHNSKWAGIGYVVDNTNSTTLYPLYRYYAETNISSPPLALFNNFFNEINSGQWTNLSRVMDGVVSLSLRGYDTNGMWLTSTYTNAQNIEFLSPIYDSQQFYCFSNTVPASVEFELGVLEDRPLRHAETLPFQSVAQTNYLSQQAGRVHLFRQLVAIPNVDPAAYQ